MHKASGGSTVNDSNQTEEEKIERVNFCLRRVNLENQNNLLPSELSGGMKKRVGIKIYLFTHQMIKVSLLENIHKYALEPLVQIFRNSLEALLT